MLLMGFGVVAAGLLLLELFMNSRWLVILGLTGLAGWFGLFAASPVFARKAAALMTVIIFPLLGISEALEKRGAALARLDPAAEDVFNQPVRGGNHDRFLGRQVLYAETGRIQRCKAGPCGPIALLFVLIILNTEKPGLGLGN